ncbi:MAG: glycosyltransferase family 39 protein, partial [Chloroflexota bacterium]
EGWSIWLSRQDLVAIALRTAADEHPPLHYWLLHFWNFVAGTNAFAGRFVSVAFGVLTIALLYRIGKRVGGAWGGVLAAFFLATARFHIWWSQDIKNYTPSIFFAFAAVWCGLEILERSSIQSSKFKIQNSKFHRTKFELRNLNYEFLYALCAALALWTHYLAALVLLALNIYAFIVIARRWLTADRRPQTTPLPPRSPAPLLFRDWLIANALAAALVAPWLALYLQNAAAWTAAPAFDFALFLKLVATVLPLGVTTNIDDYAVLTVAFTGLATLGIFANSKFKILNSKFPPADRNFELRFLNYELLFAFIVALPPILIYLLSLTPVSFFAPKIQARYLLILLPAYVMLLALGIAFLSRLSRAFAIFAFLFVLAANAFVLNDYYADRRLRDDYATLANTINAFARQDDLVLLDTDQEWPTFLYYLRAPLAWLGAPNGKAMDAASADALARRALNRHNAVWLVAIPDALATDPQKLLETRLARDLPKQFERTVDDKRLVLYAPAPRDWVNVAPENFAPQITRAGKIGNALQLLGFDLPTRELNAGDTLRLVTYWRATYPALTAVRVGGLVTATLQMPSGDLLRYENDFAIPPTASGEFPIQVDQIELARVYVAPRHDRARVGEIAHRVDYRLGNAIHLIGYDLPTLNLKPNETLNLTLYWRADRQIETSYTVFAQIVGAQFNPKQNNPLWGQVDRAPQTPTRAWLIGEIVPDAYRISIDADAPAGKYKLIVGMYDAATGARLAVDQGGDSIVIAEIEIVP